MTLLAPSQGIWFPQWAEVLASARLSNLERQTYRRALSQYLLFCKQSRQRATIASAREFISQMESQRRLALSQLPI